MKPFSRNINYVFFSFLPCIIIEVKLESFIMQLQLEEKNLLIDKYNSVVIFFISMFCYLLSLSLYQKNSDDGNEGFPCNVASLTKRT